MQKILLKTNPNDSLGGMAERTGDQFIYSERLWANPTTELDIEIERVNIRPRKLYFIGLLNFERSDTIKGKKKSRFVIML